jgi:transcriptional regulator with XRE-family HTH domain
LAETRRIRSRRWQIKQPRVAFGRAIRRLRTARGLSQERLAEDVGIHRTYIGDVERGLRNIGLLNVDRIARALETDLTGLMTEVEAERRR